MNGKIDLIKNLYDSSQGKYFYQINLSSKQRKTHYRLLFVTKFFIDLDFVDRSFPNPSTPVCQTQLFDKNFDLENCSLECDLIDD